MVMRAHIIYPNFFNKDGDGMSVGGVQTYLVNLIHLLKSKGFNISFYQTANYDFDIENDGVNIHAFFWNSRKNCLKDISKFLYEKCKTSLLEDDIVIFGADALIIKTDCKRTIGIQHGISWDIPQCKTNKSEFAYFKAYCKKAYYAWKCIKCINHAEKIVCVDYNFVNWYRALVPFQQTNLVVIPNFTEVPIERKKQTKSNDKIRIIFARRFFTYRGTRLFADSIERILNKYKNIEVTFAGEGPDEKYIRTKFENNSNVIITRYKSEESLVIHQEHDIAVVPTIGSEGTSLSLLEAMASGCAVICSNVGGMSNIVLDRYNGLMIDPYDKDSLFEALEKLLNNVELRCKLSEQAYLTVKDSFSIEIWKEKWDKVINDIITKEV